MFKKGDVHIDWVLSMGIFLIATFFLFTFISPTLQQVTPHETIANLIVESLNQESMSVIEKTPLFLKSTGTVNISFPFEGSNYFIKDSNNEMVEFSITNNRLFTVSPDDQVLWIYTSEEVQAHNNDFSCSPCPEENINSYSYGASEKLEGLSITKLNLLRNEDLKARWNIPEKNNFYLWVHQNDTLILSKKTNEPEQEVRVFVREYKDYILDSENGTLIPGVVHVEVW